MSRSRTSAVFLFAWAAFLGATIARAEPEPVPMPEPVPDPGDSLEEPYKTDVKPAEPAPREPASTVAAPEAQAPSGQMSAVIDDSAPLVDTRPRPVRARRRLALTGEVGWNGLAGFGPILGFHATPHFTVELGVGLALTGLKAGLRARYNLLKSPVTPFIGAGLVGSTGFEDLTIDDLEDPEDGTKHTVTARIRPTLAVQGVVGVDWTHPRGLTIVGTLGYSVVTKKNYEVVAGELSEDERRAFDIVFGSGPVVAGAVGYSF